MNTSLALTFQRQTFASGIDCWTVDSISDVPKFLNQIKGDHKSVLVSNLGQKELAIPGLTLDSEDLFEFAPARIRKENILKVSDIDYAAKYLPELCLWLTNDCGLILHSAHDAAALKEIKRIYWAWFSQPSILQHQARAGSESLAAKLFDAVESVVIIKKMSGTDGSAVVLSPANSAEFIEKVLRNIA